MLHNTMSESHSPPETPRAGAQAAPRPSDETPSATPQGSSLDLLRPRELPSTSQGPHGSRPQGGFLVWTNTAHAVVAESAEDLATAVGVASESAGAAQGPPGDAAPAGGGTQQPLPPRGSLDDAASSERSKPVASASKPSSGSGGFLVGIVRRVAGALVGKPQNTRSAGYLAEQLLAVAPGARRIPTAEEAAERLGRVATTAQGAERTRALRIWAATLTELRAERDAAEREAEADADGAEGDGWSQLSLSRERPRDAVEGFTVSAAEAAQARFQTRSGLSLDFREVFLLSPALASLVSSLLTTPSTDPEDQRSLSAILAATLRLTVGSPEGSSGEGEDPRGAMGAKLAGLIVVRG